MEQEAARRLASTRLRLVGGELVDLLFVSSGIEPEVVATADVTEVLPALRVPVAGIGDLIALELLARDDAARPQDAADLRALVEVASGEDLRRADASARLITERGFNRGRDIRAALEDLVATRD